MSFTVLHRVRLNIHTRNMYHENTKTRLSQLKERKHFPQEITESTRLQEPTEKKELSPERFRAISTARL